MTAFYKGTVYECDYGRCKDDEGNPIWPGYCLQLPDATRASRAQDAPVPGRGPGRGAGAGPEDRRRAHGRRLRGP